MPPGISVREFSGGFSSLFYFAAAFLSNIYTHLDYNSKVASANKILGYFPGRE